MVTKIMPGFEFTRFFLMNVWERAFSPPFTRLVPDSFAALDTVKEREELTMEKACIIQLQVSRVVEEASRVFEVQNSSTAVCMGLTHTQPNTNTAARYTAGRKQWKQQQRGVE